MTLLLLVLGVGRSIGARMHRDIHLGDIQTIHLSMNDDT